MKQLEFPKLKRKQSLTVQLDAELLNAIKDIAHRRELKLVQCVDYALKLFIAEDERKRTQE